MEMDRLHRVEAIAREILARGLSTFREAQLRSALTNQAEPPSPLETNLSEEDLVRQYPEQTAKEFRALIREAAIRAFRLNRPDDAYDLAAKIGAARADVAEWVAQALLERSPIHESPWAEAIHLMLGYGGADQENIKVLQKVRQISAV